MQAGRLMGEPADSLLPNRREILDATRGYLMRSAIFEKS
jgi:hypothetical protein